MDDSARHANNTMKLRFCNPAFASLVILAISDMEPEGFKPRIGEVWRSPEDQLEKFKAGLTHVRWGFHCATTPDGKPDSLAVDMIDEEHPLDMALRFSLCLLWASTRRGLSTGLLFGLPTTHKNTLLVRAAAKDWDYKTKRIGWDGGHVEPLSLTVNQARAGTRFA